MSRRAGAFGVASAAALGLYLGLGGHVPHVSLTALGTPPSNRGEVRAAIRYARAQLGKPYAWGGTGPDAFDCSGLTMQAYRAAGVSEPRTSQEQWAWGPEVPSSQVRPGDEVFFAGSDGTRRAPGHVGLVTNPARHLMVEAYARGFPVRVAHYGTADSAPGDRNPVGFTRPSAHHQESP